MKVIEYLYNSYQYCFNELSDPRTNKLPLMGSPLYAILIIIVYLKFVLHWGPNFMRDKKPYNINNILIIYNILQILFSACIVGVAVKYTYFFGEYNLFCEPVDKSNSPTALTIAYTTYFYFIVKIIDLLDTAFFVLRKKWSQLTFLHIFHHAGMIALTWPAAKFLPGGHVAFFGMINSAVHVLMYAYYLLAIIDKQKSIKGKKYITQLQIIQFFLIDLHYLSLLIHPYCGFPKWTALVILTENTFMLALFVDFYYKTYIKRS